jgi:hypothetical protein
MVEAYLWKPIFCIDDEETSFAATTVAHDDELAFQVWSASNGIHGGGYEERIG